MKNFLKVSLIALVFAGFTTSCNKTAETTETEVTETTTETATEGEVINADSAAAAEATPSQDTAVVEKTEEVAH